MHAADLFLLLVRQLGLLAVGAGQEARLFAVVVRRAYWRTTFQIGGDLGLLGG